MAQNDLDQRHLETLDRDLNRFSALEQATAYASRPMMGLGVSLVFILLAGLVAFYLFGQTGNTLVVVIAAGFGAYMALNIGANDVANNMGPAVGANALTMGGAIAIAAVFESAGAMLAGGDVVSTIAKGIIAPQSMQTASILSGLCSQRYCPPRSGLIWPLGSARPFRQPILLLAALWGQGSRLRDLLL